MSKPAEKFVIGRATRKSFIARDAFSCRLSWVSDPLDAERYPSRASADSFYRQLRSCLLEDLAIFSLSELQRDALQGRLDELTNQLSGAGSFLSPASEKPAPAA
jgi:hypothetical protein